ncbi:MAG: HAD family hydrolase [Chloroflexota bacterium]
MVNLKNCTHWIFDMDGTLTVAVHDFEAIRAELGLPPKKPILESIATLPDNEAKRVNQRLHEIEEALANEARPQPGANALLQTLQDRGIPMGILTRNNEPNADITLKACNLWEFFEPACILGRESATPKPDPSGIHKLLSYWQISPNQAVMVGDHRMDLIAGRRAGTTTVHMNAVDNGYWPDEADVTVKSLEELLDYLVS